MLVLDGGRAVICMRDADEDVVGAEVDVMLSLVMVVVVAAVVERLGSVDGDNMEEGSDNTARDGSGVLATGGV